MDVLVVCLCWRPQVFEFSIELEQYTDWSRKVQREGLHLKWLERDTPIMNVTFNPRNPDHIILHDMYMFCVLDQSLVRARDSLYLFLVSIYHPQLSCYKFCSLDMYVCVCVCVCVCLPEKRNTLT